MPDAEQRSPARPSKDTKDPQAPSPDEPLFRYSRCIAKLDSLLVPGSHVTCAVAHTRFLVRAPAAPQQPSHVPR